MEALGPEVARLGHREGAIAAFQVAQVFVVKATMAVYKKNVF